MLRDRHSLRIILRINFLNFVVENLLIVFWILFGNYFSPKRKFISRFISTIRISQMDAKNEGYVCDGCNVSHGRYDTLCRHKRTHHSAERRLCSHCDFSTCRPDSLLRHLRRKHGYSFGETRNLLKIFFSIADVSSSSSSTSSFSSPCSSSPMDLTQDCLSKDNIDFSDIDFPLQMEDNDINLDDIQLDSFDADGFIDEMSYAQGKYIPEKEDITDDETDERTPTQQNGIKQLVNSQCSVVPINFCKIIKKCSNSETERSYNHMVSASLDIDLEEFDRT